MTKPKGHHKKAAGPVPPPDPVVTADSAGTVAPAPGEAEVQPETPPFTGAALVELPEQTIQRLTDEAEQLKDQRLRLAAEFDNFKKRAQRERAEAWSRAQAGVVGAILDGLDDLGRVAHLDPATTPVRDVLAGVELVERKVLRVLTAAGLERVGAEGEPFDPNVHEAVSTAPASTAEQDHLVASVLQPGYRFAGSLLRPARVVVYVWQEPPPADDAAAGA